MATPKQVRIGQDTSSASAHDESYKEDPVRGNSTASRSSQDEKHRLADRPKRWTLGILADQQTDEVPGTVLLLSKFSIRNIPLGLQHETARGRSRSRGSISGEADRRRSLESKKRTADGQIILNPQPDDSANDPLNWQQWRRDAALWSLGFYCMLGGGMTPILAAGFNQVAADLDVSYAEVARTTGLYMMGLGLGSVIFSPTAIIFGKRPVYLLSAVTFIVSSIWCALSPDYANLVVARIFQGIAVSPVECLPSATIAEVFFLHERAFRIGIYTLLLLGGKNLVPLISAVIIQALSWRWVFWVITILVALGAMLLFLFVPETFWDRTPRPKGLARSSISGPRGSLSKANRQSPIATRQPEVAWTDPSVDLSEADPRKPSTISADTAHSLFHGKSAPRVGTSLDGTARGKPKLHLGNLTPEPAQDDSNMPQLHSLNSPYYLELEKNDNYLSFPAKKEPTRFPDPIFEDVEKQDSPVLRAPTSSATASASAPTSPEQTLFRQATSQSYTTGLRVQPAKPWAKSLKPWNGRLTKVSWWRAAIRPGILFAYPAVLWSAMVYSLSVGWLIVLSESISHIFSTRDSYNFNSLQIGLVYLSPFIGGVLGTAVAGKVSDVLVRFMARRNDGIYEPEYRLIMAIPIAISTAIGLMGFGWSAEERDAWIVPTVFFGIISFGCSLGSTTAITFCVDSYRQYAGEALVTLNFSKNIFHGLVWSLFFPQWLEADGSKTVFVAIGGIQLGCMLLTIPMYIFGKRARMWTVRKALMEGF
ncbi:hypothetical protein LTR64_001167 [Lithohypha guttulata]|uniref:uncharacterized protein n=1 Tax=Lithohypha guttulata TaxID=1690604 RepID=UPI002DDE9241|nr:hypothetical protein LTR51_003361 [Lithohypha guttulata]